MKKYENAAGLKSLAIETAKMCNGLPSTKFNNVYVGQILRSSSSSASNYRSACRAKSKKDFINKLGTVDEELDETMFFYEMIAEFNSSVKAKLRILYKEANELLSIVVSSINTARENMLNEIRNRMSGKKGQ